MSILYSHAQNHVYIRDHRYPAKVGGVYNLAVQSSIFFGYSAAMAARIVRCESMNSVSQFIINEELSSGSKFVKRDNTKEFGSDGKHLHFTSGARPMASMWSVLSKN